MDSLIGPKPPVHSRFNERRALIQIGNRYRRTYQLLRPQIEKLQSSPEFCEQAEAYYAKGYLDWILLTVALNVMGNCLMHEMFPNPKENNFQIKNSELYKKLKNRVFEPTSFLGKNFEMCLNVTNMTILKTWGFEYRKEAFRPQVVERFLIERMRYFEIDFPHSPLFRPNGTWPDVVNTELEDE